MTQQQPKSQKHVSQKELKKFAATYQDVTQIRDKYTSKLQGAKDKKHAQKIASQAQDKMKSAIKNHGFTLSEYTDVVKAINSNPKLQKQFLKMTKGSSGASSSS
jgi:GTP1/Obg family GTP-binding protein